MHCLHSGLWSDPAEQYIHNPPLPVDPARDESTAQCTRKGGDNHLECASHAHASMNEAPLIGWKRNHCSSWTASFTLRPVSRDLYGSLVGIGLQKGDTLLSFI